MDTSNYPDVRAKWDKAVAAGNLANGLKTDMASFRNKYGIDSKEYKGVVAKYNAAKAQADTAQTEYEAILERAKNTEQRKKDAETTAKRKEQDTARASVLQERYAQAVEQGNADAIATAKAALDQSKVDTATKDTPPPVVQDPAADGAYGAYTIQNGQVLSGGQKPAPVYLVSLPTYDLVNNKQDVVQTPFDGVASAREAFIKAYYVGDAKIKELQSKLLADKWITQNDIKTGNWRGGLDDFITAYTLHSVDQGQSGLAKDSIPTNSFFGVLKGGGGTATSKQYRTFSTRGEAKQLLDTYYTDLMGRTATVEEQADFFDKLHTAENKAVSTVTGQTTVGSTLADADRMVIAAQVAKASLKGTDAETILSNKTGSKVAIDIANLQRNAAAYGHILSAGDAFKLVANNVGQADFLNKQTERLRQLAITMNPNLAQHIKDGGTVKEVADTYAQIKARKLGVAVPDSVADKDVMNAITQNGGLMTTSDFTRQMQADPLWRKTEEAHNTAADFANTILQSFGFGG